MFKRWQNINIIDLTLRSPCEGLTLIKPRDPEMIGSQGICTSLCGNAKCDPATETAYNCTQDCGEISAISRHDLEVGWYYGSLKQKKPGMPDDWIHDGEGTRSACWHRHGAWCGQESNIKPCAKENKMCGGIAGVLCCPGLACKYDGSYPDASGVCITFPDPREEILMKFDPSLTSEQRLIVPNTVTVGTSSKPVKVELYAGPTGTGTAGLEKLIESNSKPVGLEMAGLYRFVFHIKNCDQVSSRFIARVYWDDGKVNDQVSEPLYCK